MRFIEWCHFQRPWVTPWPSIQVHAITWCWISQKWYEIETSLQWNTYRDLHTPHSTVSFRITLSDLAKYSMTWSNAQPPCNSWASCLRSLRPVVKPFSPRYTFLVACVWHEVTMFVICVTVGTRSSAVAERPRELRFIEYFAKSLKVE